MLEALRNCTLQDIGPRQVRRLGLARSDAPGAQVLDEMWHFADYLQHEVESHTSLDPPLEFPEDRWDSDSD